MNQKSYQLKIKNRISQTAISKVYELTRERKVALRY